MTPAPGDVWQWPDGKLTIVSREAIRAGGLLLCRRGNVYRWALATGRRRDEPYMLETAVYAFGVSE